MEPIEDWNAELLLQVIDYLNVADAGHFALQSRRCYYLVHTFRSLRGVHVASSQSASSTSSTNEQLSAEQLCRSVTSRLQSPPALALAYSTTSSTQRLRETLPNLVPRETIVLGAVTDSIQTASGIQGAYESQSSDALMMLAGLSPEDGSVVCPFYVQTEQIEGDEQAFLESYRDATFDANLDWSMFIFYVCGFGDRFADAMVQTFQAKYPKATMVGGICNMAYVSTPIHADDYTSERLGTKTIPGLCQMIQCLGGGVTVPYTLYIDEVIHRVMDLADTAQYVIRFVHDHPGQGGGICGVALANVPVQSFATRGVESLIGRKLHQDGTPQASTTFFVHEAAFYQYGDEDYMFDTDQDDAPPYHVVRSIIDTSTGQIYRPRDMLQTFGQPEFLGFQTPDTDGFVLETAHSMSEELDTFVLFLESARDTLLGANIDFFTLCGQACLRDMDHCVRELQTATAHETVLGGLAIICYGRGPEAGPLVAEDMADAKRLAQAFPHVPWVGFYAGGEIGAAIHAGRQSVFGKETARIQGYTTVVCRVDQADRTCAGQ